MTTAATLRTQGVTRCLWPDDLDDECPSAAMQALTHGTSFRAGWVNLFTDTSRIQQLMSFATDPRSVLRHSPLPVQALDAPGQFTSRKLSASTRTTGVREVCQHAGVKCSSSVTTAEMLS